LREIENNLENIERELNMKAIQMVAVESFKNQVMRVATHSNLNLLICGPTGSGKSTLAKKIHDEGARRREPFILVNLATLYEGTLESELFGHEKGAFTGADRKKRGWLELAHRGTVFLDEVGELPLRLQGKLLEFLQSRRIASLGGNHETQLDVRVIAATNRDLEKEVRAGRFREDLFHRLRVVEVKLPSLLERGELFGEILHQLLTSACHRLNATIHSIDEDVALCLEGYSWPGNLRELNNVLEYAVISSEGKRIRMSDLPPHFTESVRIKKSGYGGSSEGDGAFGCLELCLGSNYAETYARFEKEYLQRALARHQGKINRTARSIGVSKATLIRRMNQYELAPAVEASLERAMLSVGLGVEPSQRVRG
jgi:DNA-binding NtrC family response regulator